MSKELVISTSPHETRVAILEKGNLVEIYVEREKEYALVGSIYKGRVTRVLPGMQSAFVDIGLDTDAFLYVSDVLEEIEGYDQIVSTVEEKVAKMEEQGGQVFSGQGEQTTAEPPEVTADEDRQPSFDAEPQPPQLGEQQPGGYRQDNYRREGYRQDNYRGQGNQDNYRGQGNQDNYRGQGNREGGYRGSGAQGGYRPGGRPGGGGERGDRGGYGRGRGPGGRGGRGRFRGRGPGRRDDDRRSLPSSKYVSPGGQPRDFGGPPRGYSGAPRFEPPREPAEVSGEYEPILLPGESLAKYKNRAPGSSGLAGPLAAGAIPTEAEPATMDEAAAAENPQEANGTIAASSLESMAGGAAAERFEAALVEEAAEEEIAEAPVEMEEEHAGEEAEEETEAERAQESTETHEERAGEGHEENGKESLSESEAASVLEAAEEEAQDATLAEEPEGHTTEGYPETEREREAAGEDQTDREIREGILGEAAGAESHEPEQPEPYEQRTARVQGDSRQRFNRPEPYRREGGQRGGRPYRGGRPHGGRREFHPPRKQQSISELLKAGQEVIIQIAKEPLGKKGARITSHVALPGRFLVYMPTLQHVGVSRKISSGEARARLRHLVTEYNTKFPGGFIVRTAAETASEEEVRADIEYLGKTWQEIRSRAEQRKAPALLHRDLNLVERVLRDYFSPDFTAIWVDNQEEYTRVAEFIGRFQPELVSRVKLYTKEAPIFEEFGIQQEIDKALRPKVWLKSGGYIVINHTEALVAIDVNTGKFVGKGSNRLEDTIVKTNVEACKEIVRQIRLRDLGGIIVVDFIDMEERRNRAKVMQALEEALREDKAPSKVLGFNEFGLVNITRKRTKQALERVLCQPCIYCSGSGMVKSIHTICYEAQAEARKMAPELDGQSLTLRVHPEIAKALKTRESGLVEELEKWVKKSVIIHGDPSLHWEQYDIY
ncbi:MAG TPA: Rne/Rng family ribonuclease [Candidatus Acidoferrales bacterium]|nr:Rne/Rng family ribonuclease [Candidatus Acidoferrales bacterium]